MDGSILPVNIGKGGIKELPQLKGKLFDPPSINKVDARLLQMDNEQLTEISAEDLVQDLHNDIYLRLGKYPKQRSTDGPYTRTKTKDKDKQENSQSTNQQIKQPSETSIEQPPSPEQPTSNTPSSDEHDFVFETDAGTNPATRKPRIPGQHPMYKILSNVEPNYVQRGLIFEEILKQDIPISLKSLMGISPEFRKFVTERSRGHRVPVQGPQPYIPTNSLLLDTSKPYHSQLASAPSGTAPVTLNGVIFEKAIIDSGAEAVVISENAVRRANLDIHEGTPFGLTGATDHSANFLGHTYLPITVLGIFTLQMAFVSTAKGYDILLGTPWQRAVRLVTQYLEDGSLLCIAKDPTTHAKISWIAASASDKRLKGIEEIGTPIPVLSASLYELGLTPLEQVQVAVNTLYKRKDKKVQPANVPLLNGRVLVGVATEKKSTPPHGSIPAEIDLFFELIADIPGLFAFSAKDEGLISATIEEPTYIETIPHQPWQLRSIPLNPKLSSSAIQIIKQQFANGQMEPSAGPYRNRWFLVAKKSGDYRLIVDCQPLNAVTKRDAFQPPHADLLAESFSGYPMLSFVDVKNGYGQKEIARECRDMTAIQTPIGLVRLTRLPQGWTNSVAAFQRVMSTILREYLPDSVGVFIDDIGIRGPQSRYNDQNSHPGVRRFVEEHLHLLSKVLHTLHDSGLTISAAKLELCRSGTTFVGYYLTEEGRFPEPRQLRAIEQWPRPQSAKGIRSFLGVTTYYRVWIKNYALLAEPLYELLRKEVEFEWSSRQEDAFQALKAKLIANPVLKPLDYNSPIIMNVDASDLRWGATLGQDDPVHNHRHASRYESGSWNQTELRYSTIKQECLALNKALHKFRYWLTAVHFQIETDASSLIWMINQPPNELPQAVYTRWVTYIRLFDFEIKHIPGKTNTAADGLSRIKAHQVNLTTSTFLYRGFSLQDIHNHLQHMSTPEQITSRQRRHFLQRTREFCISDQNHLFRIGNKLKMPQRVLQNNEEVSAVLRKMHDEFGHRGFDGCGQRVRVRYWWPTMNKDIKDYIKTCELCQRVSPRGRQEEPLHPTIPQSLWTKVAVDIIHMPLSGGYQYIVVARDDFSGWVEARALAEATSENIVRFLYEDIFCRYGCPHTLLTDNGPENRGVTEALLKHFGIKHIKTTSHHPHGNGMVERGHQPIIEALAKMPGEWPQNLFAILWADRCTVRSSTGYTLFFLVFGSQALLPVEFAFATWPVDLDHNLTTEELLLARAKQLTLKTEDLEKATEKLMDSRLYNKEYFDQRNNLRDQSLPLGSLVLRYDMTLSTKRDHKLYAPWSGPYRITNVYPNSTYLLEELDGTPLAKPIHGRQLKSFYPRRFTEPTGSQAGGRDVSSGISPSQAYQWFNTTTTDCNTKAINSRN